MVSKFGIKGFHGEQMQEENVFATQILAPLDHQPVPKLPKALTMKTATKVSDL